MKNLPESLTSLTALQLETTKVLEHGVIAAITPEGNFHEFPYIVLARYADSGPFLAVLGYIDLKGVTPAHANSVKWYGGKSFHRGDVFGVTPCCYGRNDIDEAAERAVAKLTDWATARPWKAAA